MRALLIFLFLSTSLTAQQEGFAPSVDLDIFYSTFGQGPPVLIINGGPGFSSEGFEPLAQKVAALGYQTIIYDQRGTGRSKLTAPDSSNITMDLMTHDIEALRQHLGIEQWVVFGHSFGGMLANYYATKHPQRIRGIIASSSGGMDLGLLENLDITAKLSPQERDSLAFWSARIRGGDTSAHARLQRARALAGAYLFNRKHHAAVAERLTQSNMEINQLMWSNLRSIGFDCKAALAEFTKPVLIIQGQGDILDASVARKADFVLPQSQLVFLDSCRHYGWLDRPEAYFSSIQQFLNAIRH